MYVRGMTHAWVYPRRNPIVLLCCNAADVLHKTFGKDVLESVLGLQQ